MCIRKYLRGVSVYDNDNITTDHIVYRTCNCRVAPCHGDREEKKSACSLCVCTDGAYGVYTGPELSSISVKVSKKKTRISLILKRLMVLFKIAFFNNYRDYRFTDALKSLCIRAYYLEIS